MALVLASMTAVLWGPPSSGSKPAQALAAPASAVDFRGERSYGVGDGPYSVRAADLNDDAVADLVVAKTVPSSNNVSILLGRGDGTFRAAVHYAAGNGPRTVATADFDGDGTIDLAVANVRSGDVSILSGNGDGTFGATASYTAGDRPRTVITPDLDGDGIPDLAVVNRDSHNVSVLIGKGDGTFRTAVNYGTGANPFDVTTADFDGDAKADLAVANREADNVSILLGDGDGTFGAAVNYEAGDGPYALATADLNGDAKADLAVGKLNSKNVSILLGNGDGTFKAAVNYGAGVYAFDVKIADLNRDGDADLAVASYPRQINTYPGNFSILPGRGDGTFGKPIEYGVGNGPVAVAPADFNRDGKPDVAVANINSGDVTVLLQGSTSLGLSANPLTLTYPADTTLTGKITSAGGASLAGESVILEQRPWVHEEFTRVPNQPAEGVPVSSDGSFGLAGVEPRWTTDYRARFVGDPASGTRPAISPLAAVELKVRVSLNVADTALKLGQSTAISGAVAPEHTDMSVKLTFERNGMPLATETVPLVDSRYRFAYKPPRTGRYSVVAGFPDHPPGHLGNTSPMKTFEVTR